MARAGAANTAPDVATIKLKSTIKLTSTIFPGDPLATDYHKRFRRPIVDVANFNTALSILNLAVNGTIADDEDGGGHGDGGDAEGDDSAIGDTVSMDVSLANGVNHDYAHSLLTANAGTANKIRIAGGRAAVPKKISADLDSEDELIKMWKDKGESNDTIVARLIERQGTRYDPKTIATRYSRMKRALHASDQQRMEDEFSDFHEDEDESLLESFEKTQAEFDRQVKDVEQKRWERLASMMVVKLQKSKYNTQACRERVEGLRNGNAILPQEQDADPVRRAEEATERVKERLRVRAAASEKAKHEEAERIRIKRERITDCLEENSKRLAERAVVKAKKDAEVAEKNALREAKQDVRKQAVARKAAKEQAKRDSKAAADRKRRNEQAARAYEKENAKNTRAAETLRNKLAKVENQRLAQLKKLEELQEEADTREIIRRKMREAGVETKAPLSKEEEPENNRATKRMRKASAGLKRRAPLDDDTPEVADEKPIKKISGNKRVKPTINGQSTPAMAFSSPRNSVIS